MEEIEKGLHVSSERRDVGSVGSSTAARDGSTGALDELAELAERARQIPAPPRSRWHRAGLTRRGERVLDLGSGLLVALLTIGWTWSIADAAVDDAEGTGNGAAPMAASALASTDAPNMAYLTDASLRALVGSLRGSSGKLRAEIRPAGSPVVDSSTGDVALVAEDARTHRTDVTPGAGVWRLALAAGNAIKPISDFSVIALRPLGEKRNGRVGLYYLGTWPGEHGKVTAPKKAPPDRYRPPSGFIEVTRENAGTPVSEHFTLRDFLTHDQANVWPKYLVLEMRNVDKLELVLNDLAAHGVDVSGVRVMSGFRTPQYNKGGGETAGRAELSRHMYGDAADIFIDSDHDGVMDDLDHDGRHTIADARVVGRAVDRVEAAHPELIGGAGVYPAAPGHGPFIHIDSRGYRARWIGSGGGS
jgi:uncharacterized protein YcbK (DUF882 family)